MIVRVGVAVAVNMFVVSYNSQIPFNTDTEGAIKNVRISGVRALARFFVKGGGIIASVEGTSLVGGSRGILPLKRFKFGGSEMLFSALVMRCLRKIDLEYENGKQLQVTTIKVTESEESKSIQRLDVSGSTGPGGQLPPLPPR